MGAIASAVGNIFAGNKAAEGAEKAAKAVDKRYHEIKGMGKPYMDAGKDALDLYRTSVGLNGADKQSQYFANFQNDPGWQASMDHATRGLENSNAIRGRGYGGNVIAGLGDYLQKNMLDAYKTRQSQIGGLVDVGTGTLGTIAGAGTAAAGQQGQHLANAGYYKGAGIANAFNALEVGQGNASQAAAYGQGSGGGGLASAGNFLSFLG
jgi:hypothetical protein